MTHKSLSIAILFVTSFVLTVCLGGIKYYPKELKNYPPEEVAVIYVGNVLGSNVEIDGMKIDVFSLAHISVGRHIAKVKKGVREPTKEWAEILQSMEQRGFEFDEKDTFTKSENGTVLTAKPVLPIFAKKYDVEIIWESVVFCTEPGKRYDLITVDGKTTVYTDGSSADC